MSVRAPFQPKYGSGQVVSPAVGSSNIFIGKGNKNVCLSNQGAAVCFVRVGVGTQVATNADYAVPPNAQVVITKSDDDDNLAHVSAAGTLLHVIVGEGW